MGHLFGIRPWEMGLMRVGEMRACRAYVRDMNRSA